MPFDADGNYVVGAGDDQMMSTGVADQTGKKKNRFQSFLGGMQPQPGGGGGGVLGGLSALAGHGSVGGPGVLGSVARFLI